MNITSFQFPEHVKSIPGLYFFTLDFLSLECSLSFSPHFSGQSFFWSSDIISSTIVFKAFFLYVFIFWHMLSKSSKHLIFH